MDFTKIIPRFTFTVNNFYAEIHMEPIEGADLYEIYQDGENRGDSPVLVKSGSLPEQEFQIKTATSAKYYVVASRKENGKRIYTQKSEKVQIDLFTGEQEKIEKVTNLYEDLKNAVGSFSNEDFDVLKEALNLAQSDIAEKEERRRQEELARERKQKLEEEQKKRAEAARKAQELAEKKHRQHVEEVTRMDLPLDWNNPFENDERVSQHCETPEDALVMSIDMLGIVDIEFIASLTGMTLKEVIESLAGYIYQNPLFWDECFYKGWETSDEYLSGNLLHKLETAKKANEEYNGYFTRNITAIEGIIGESVRIEDVYITLGSPWIPGDIIDSFIEHLVFGEEKQNEKDLERYQADFLSQNYQVTRDEVTGVWKIPELSRFNKGAMKGKYDTIIFSKYGADRMGMLEILQNTLNIKTIQIFDASPSDPKKKVLNQVETMKVTEKQEELIREFQNWVLTDPMRKERLENLYNRRFGFVRSRKYDGSYLTFQGLNPSVQLYDYQKNAVARILFAPNTLLAHDVGSGKTYEMIVAGMELRRLGKSKKNMYVVPNAILGQWRSLFRKLYPQANVLVVNHKNFDKKHRSETLLKIMNEDTDAILISYSCFDMLPLSDKYMIEVYKERLKTLEKAKNGVNGTTKKAIEEALTKIQESYQKNPQMIGFDSLGINTLFVDESHNFKNVGVETKLTRVKGLTSGVSRRAKSMMDKVHCVQRMNRGGRIVFASGTPVTNSMSDLYVIQRYLQEGEMEFKGILQFDAWVGQYAQKESQYEVDIDTTHLRLVTRFTRFCNIPELVSMLSSIIDYHKVDTANGIPVVDGGYSDSVSAGSQDFQAYLHDLSIRADDVRNHRVDRKVDNMLKITTDGRKAALDMRLIDEAFGMDMNSKTVRCAQNIIDEYARHQEERGVQLVFCDASTPKPSFNLYQDLKTILTQSGIPEDEIAFIHDATTDEERDQLFMEARRGGIRVLIGSTTKMGHGVNVQDRLCALHHLDIPWKPSDMVQREGRILRQGNQYEKVHIYRYVTNTSFDAYSWQLLEAKQRFISQIMKGEATVRAAEDIDDQVLSYAEVKALAVGNPKLKRRIEVVNEIDRYLILENAEKERRVHLREQKENLIARIDQMKDKIEKCGQDIAELPDVLKLYNAMKYEEQKEIREKIGADLTQHNNQPAEFLSTTYMGFDVVIPAYMVSLKETITSEIEEEGREVDHTHAPVRHYVHLRRHGSYYLELESTSGITKRLNNFLTSLPEVKEKFERQLDNLEHELIHVKHEIEHPITTYQEKIDELYLEMQELNHELGLTESA